MGGARLAIASALLAGCSAGPVPSPSSAPSAHASPSEPGASPTIVLPEIPAALPTRAAPPIETSAVPGRIHLDGAGSTSAWIGPGGGRLAATASDGTAYSLDIPADAVLEATPIAMIPIRSVDGLELSGGLVGAVYLEPAGLQLAEPATLEIRSSKALPPGMRLAGVDAEDDGTTDLTPALAVDGAFRMPVFHFSAPGAGFGTTVDLQRIAPPAAGGRLSTALSALLAEDVPWSATTSVEAYAGIVSVWGNAIEPELSSVADDQALLGALADWRQFVFILNLYAHHGDVVAALADGSLTIVGPFPTVTDPTILFLRGQTLVGQAIAAALAGNLARCNQSHALAALANIPFWADLGARYDPSSRDWPALSGGCATIIIRLFNPASNLRAGGSDAFQIALGLQFSDGTQVPGDFQLTLHGGGFVFASTGGAEATAGEVASTTLTFGVAAQQGPPYALTASACWSLDALARKLCSGPIQRSFGSAATPTQAPTGTSNPGTFRLLAGQTNSVNTCGLTQILFDRALPGPISWNVTGPYLRLYPEAQATAEALAPHYIYIGTSAVAGTLVVTATAPDGSSATVNVTVVKTGATC